MPALSPNEAIDRIVNQIGTLSEQRLGEVSDELFPQSANRGATSAAKITSYLRSEAAVEEVVDVWNVVFPDDRNVWYDEQTQRVYFNEELVGSLDR